MTVKVLIGDLFESKAQTLVNTVNCVGVMGKGIALEFRKHFPDMYDDYVARCERNEVKLGKPYLYKRLLPPWILNFPTKDHWRSVANLNSIIEGLEHMLDHYREWGIESLAVPPLGCGQGQLDWAIVGPTLYRYLNQMEIPVELYAPYGTPHEELQPEFLQKADDTESLRTPQPERIKPAWVALVEILKRIEDHPYHWPVGRTIFQKIAFVATEEGLPTTLEYERSSYGPFSPQLKGVITKLINNGLIREERLGRMFHVRVGPTYEDARKVYGEDLERWEEIIEKITDLFLRLNTKQAEIVATVLYSGRSLRQQQSKPPAEMDVLKNVMDWKQRRKPPLEEAEVASTIRNLAMLGWLEVKPSDDLPVPHEALPDF